MSIVALAYVLRNSRATLGPRLVVIALAEFAHDDGTRAFPSIKTLEERTLLSRRGVQAALRKLEEMGEIVCTGETRAGTRVYSIRMGAHEMRGEGEPRSEGGAGGAPNPSGEPSSRTPASSAGGAGASEPINFSMWLAMHVDIAETYGIKQSVPRAGTSHRAELARRFGEIAAEGFELEEFALASEGVLADRLMVEGGHVAPDNVLRKTKFGAKVDAGRRAREKRLEAGARGDKYDGLEAVEAV